MIRTLLLLLLLTSISVLSSCKTTRITTDIQRDTIISLKPVQIPFDTALKIKGDTAHKTITVPGISPTVTLDTQKVKLGNTTVNASIRDGKLFIDVQQKDTTVSIHGIAFGHIKDTTVNITKTKTITKELSFWGELWLKIQGAGVVLMIIAILIILLFAGMYFRK